LSDSEKHLPIGTKQIVAPAVDDHLVARDQVKVDPVVCPKIRLARVGFNVDGSLRDRR
jgi:hypothetical protein